MKEKIKHYAKEIAIFIIVMTLFANGLSLYKSTSLNNSALEMNTITLIDNSVYSCNNDKPTLIHFWATWCPTCKVEASNIQTISKSYEVITIAVKSGTKEEINTWLSENSYDFKVINDNTGILSSKFKVAAFPTTFIYNKNKELVFSDVGYTSTIGLYLRMWWASL